VAKRGDALKKGLSILEMMEVEADEMNEKMEAKIKALKSANY